MEELDLKELFEIFWSRRIYIVLITLIFIMIGFIYSYLFVEAEYKSETSLLLVKQDGETSASGSITTSDLTLNQQLISTYNELIKSKDILEKVINNLKLDLSKETLEKAITVSSVKNTALIKISVVNTNPKLAKDIANEIVIVFTDKVKEIYKIDNVNVIDEAEVEENPYNINHIKDLAVFAFIGIVVSGIYALIANMLDTTIKSKESLEKKLGLSVLTEIPYYNFNETKPVKGGRR